MVRGAAAAVGGRGSRGARGSRRGSGSSSPAPRGRPRRVQPNDETPPPPSADPSDAPAEAPAATDAGRRVSRRQRTPNKRLMPITNGRVEPLTPPPPPPAETPASPPPPPPPPLTVASTRGRGGRRTRSAPAAGRGRRGRPRKEPPPPPPADDAPSVPEANGLPPTIGADKLASPEHSLSFCTVRLTRTELPGLSAYNSDSQDASEPASGGPASEENSMMSDSMSLGGTGDSTARSGDPVSEEQDSMTSDSVSRDGTCESVSRDATRDSASQGPTCDSVSRTDGAAPKRSDSEGDGEPQDEASNPPKDPGAEPNEQKDNSRDARRDSELDGDGDVVAAKERSDSRSSSPDSLVQFRDPSAPEQSLGDSMDLDSTLEEDDASRDDASERRREPLVTEPAASSAAPLPGVLDGGREPMDCEPSPNRDAGANDQEMQAVDARSDELEAEDRASPIIGAVNGRIPSRVDSPSPSPSPVIDVMNFSGPAVNAVNSPRPAANHRGSPSPVVDVLNNSHSPAVVNANNPVVNVMNHRSPEAEAQEDSRNSTVDIADSRSPLPADRLNWRDRLLDVSDSRSSALDSRSPLPDSRSPLPSEPTEVNVPSPVPPPDVDENACSLPSMASVASKFSDSEDSRPHALLLPQTRAYAATPEPMDEPAEPMEGPAEPGAVLDTAPRTSSPIKMTPPPDVAPDAECESSPSPPPAEAEPEAEAMCLSSPSPVEQTPMPSPPVQLGGPPSPRVEPAPVRAPPESESNSLDMMSPRRAVDETPMPSPPMDIGRIPSPPPDKMASSPAADLQCDASLRNDARPDKSSVNVLSSGSDSVDVGFPSLTGEKCSSSLPSSSVADRDVSSPSPKMETDRPLSPPSENADVLRGTSKDVEVAPVSIAVAATSPLPVDTDEPSSPVPQTISASEPQAMDAVRFASSPASSPPSPPPPASSSPPVPASADDRPPSPAVEASSPPSPPPPAPVVEASPPSSSSPTPPAVDKPSPPAADELPSVEEEPAASPPMSEDSVRSPPIAYSDDDGDLLEMWPLPPSLGRPVAPPSLEGDSTSAGSDVASPVPPTEDDRSPTPTLDERIKSLDVNDSPARRGVGSPSPRRGSSELVEGDVVMRTVSRDDARRAAAVCDIPLPAQPPLPPSGAPGSPEDMEMSTPDGSEDESAPQDTRVPAAAAVAGALAAVRSSSVDSGDRASPFMGLFDEEEAGSQPSEARAAGEAAPGSSPQRRASADEPTGVARPLVSYSARKLPRSPGASPGVAPGTRTMRVSGDAAAVLLPPGAFPRWRGISSGTLQIVPQSQLASRGAVIRSSRPLVVRSDALLSRAETEEADAPTAPAHRPTAPAAHQGTVPLIKPVAQVKTPPGKVAKAPAKPRAPRIPKIGQDKAAGKAGKSPTARSKAGAAAAAQLETAGPSPTGTGSLTPGQARFLKLKTKFLERLSAGASPRRSPASAKTAAATTAQAATQDVSGVGAAPPAPSPLDIPLPPARGTPDAATTQDKRTKDSRVDAIKDKDVNKLRKFKTISDSIWLKKQKLTKQQKEARHMVCDCCLSPEETERGDMGCGEDCLNRLLMIECGSRCPLGDRCSNKRFTKKETHPTSVFKTELKGYGLRADVDMPENAFIYEYVGEVLDSEEFKRRTKEYDRLKYHHYYFMALKADAIIDATEKGNASRFINHSCDPNSETQKWTVNGELRIGFFTRRPVSAGEEITFDYQLQRYGKEAQRCFCGSEICRGWIGEKTEDDSSSEEEEEELVENALPENAVALTAEQLAPGAAVATPEAAAAVAAVAAAAAAAGIPMTVAAVPGMEGVTAGVPAVGAELQPGVVVEGQTVPPPVVPPRPPKVTKQARMKRDAEKRDLELEIKKLVSSGLKSKQHTLELSRLMVRAEAESERLTLLELIRTADHPCRRLFLDYHGLRLLWSWMASAPSPQGNNDDEVYRFRRKVLETLQTLPIPNKTCLSDSRVLGAVERWSGAAQPAAARTPDQDGGGSDAASSCDTPVIGGGDSPAAREVEELAGRLLQSWSGLKEVFRIPKKERVEIMREHEKEADRSQLPVQPGPLPSRDPRTARPYHRPPSPPYRHHQRLQLLADRGYQTYLQQQPRPGITTVKKGYDCTTEQRKRAWDSPEPADLRLKRYRPMMADSRLSKEQRRQLFMMEVQREEEERKQRQQQQQLWRGHEKRCAMLGLDPHLTPIFDPSYQYYWEPSSGAWQPYTPGDPAVPLVPAPGVDPLHFAALPQQLAVYQGMAAVDPAQADLFLEQVAQARAAHASPLLFLPPGPGVTAPQGDGTAPPPDGRPGLLELIQSQLPGRFLGGDGCEISLSSVPAAAVDGGTAYQLASYNDPSHPNVSVGNVPLPAAAAPGQSPPPPPPPPEPVITLPPRWRIAKDDQDRIYFYHQVTRQCQWTPPVSADWIPPPGAVTVQQSMWTAGGSSADSSPTDGGSSSESDSDSSSSSDEESKPGDEEDEPVAHELPEDMAKEEDIDRRRMVDQHRRRRGKRRDRLVQERVISPVPELSRQELRRERHRLKREAKAEARRERQLDPESAPRGPRPRRRRPAPPPPPPEESPEPAPDGTDSPHAEGGAEPPDPLRESETGDEEMVQSSPAEEEAEGEEEEEERTRRAKEERIRRFKAKEEALRIHQAKKQEARARRKRKLAAAAAAAAAAALGASSKKRKVEVKRVPSSASSSSAGASSSSAAAASSASASSSSSSGRKEKSSVSSASASSASSSSSSGRKEKPTTAAADTSSEVARKIKDKFLAQMSGVIVSALNAFRKSDCKQGRITSNEDFKFLAKKLTHHVMVKELRNVQQVEELSASQSVKHKAKYYVRKYMGRFGETYSKETILAEEPEHADAAAH